MEKFFEFIIITILVIWALGFFGRLLLRYWLKKKQKEFAQQFGQAAGGFSQTGARSRKQAKREGEVSVEQTLRVEKKVNKGVGEYVEFEEVEVTEEIKDTE